MTAPKAGGHTPGPWELNGPLSIESADRYIGNTDTRGENDNDAANAERIVACVNACEGVSDPAAMVQAFRKEIEIARALSSRVAELEAALLQVEAHHRDLNRKADRPEERSYTLRVVRAALAKVRALSTTKGA